MAIFKKWRWAGPYHAMVSAGWTSSTARLRHGTLSVVSTRPVAVSRNCVNTDDAAPGTPISGSLRFETIKGLPVLPCFLEIVKWRSGRRCAMGGPCTRTASRTSAGPLELRCVIKGRWKEPSRWRLSILPGRGGEITFVNVERGRTAR